MKLAITLDMKDGTGQHTRIANLYVPDNPEDRPDYFWYEAIKALRIVLREWAHKKLGDAREEGRAPAWRYLSEEWEAPINQMIHAAREALEREA